MQPVEARNSGCRQRLQLEIGLRGFGCGIGPIRQQREVNVAACRGQVVHLEAFELGFERGGRCQHHGNDHHAA